MRKTARSFRNISDLPTYRPTDTASSRVAGPRLKMLGKCEMLTREKPNLSLNAKFCISKYMACFSKLFRLMPCFSKCKILHSETDSVFHARLVNARNSIFVENPSILDSFLSLLLGISYRKIVFFAKY